MRNNDQTTRRGMRCGYEEPLATGVAWDHAGREVESADDRPTTCIGYTRKLPEVIEIARAHLHWSKGALSIDGMPDSAIVAIEILEGACNARDHWSMTPASKGGGGWSG